MWKNTCETWKALLQDVFWNHALVKFWFAHSLGDVPVYPPWRLLDAVARVLQEPRQWARSSGRMAFVLPGAQPNAFSPEQKAAFKETYVSRKAFSITKGCPLTVSDFLSW